MDQAHFIHEEWYQIKGYDVDRNLTMRTTSLIQAMHDAATAQVIELKVSATELQPLSLGWVLVQQDLEIFHYPSMGQRIKFKTYPSGKDRAYTYRDYYVYSEDELLIAQASTSWILMDTNERKMGPYPPQIEEILKRSNAMPHLNRPEKRSEEHRTYNQSKIFEVQFSDIDFNGHLSNHCFFKWMIDALPAAFISENQIVRFNIRFKGEAFQGDRIHVKHLYGAKKVFHQLVSKGKVLASGYSDWQKIPGI